MFPHLSTKTCLHNAIGRILPIIFFKIVYVLRTFFEHVWRICTFLCFSPFYCILESRLDSSLGTALSSLLLLMQEILVAANDDVLKTHRGWV